MPHRKAARAAARLNLEASTAAHDRQVAITANHRRQVEGQILYYLAAGGTELDCARITGWSRTTVRKIAGKLPPAERQIPGQLTLGG